MGNTTGHPIVLRQREYADAQDAHAQVEGGAHHRSSASVDETAAVGCAAVLLLVLLRIDHRA